MTTEATPDARRPWRRVALRIEHLSKTFPGTRALNDVSLEVEAGTIHCLLGGNGSGKSSLIKILAGVYQGDPGGTITIDDVSEPADRTTPEWARAAGLHFVHQDLAVFDGLSVAENLAIGRGFPVQRFTGAIRWRTLNRRARDVLDRFQIHVDPSDSWLIYARRTTPWWPLPGRCRTSFLPGTRASWFSTSRPSPCRRRRWMSSSSALRQYARAGQTILLVTHRLEEVISIADRVTVLRDGNVVATLDADQFDYDKLVELIVGRALDSEVTDGVTLEGEDLLLEVSDLAVGPLRGVTFGLRRGEVLGVAGLLGSGRTTLLTTLFGLRAMTHGTTKLDGQPVAFANVDQAMDAGLAFVPENRSDSAFLDMDLRENISAADVPKYWHRFVLHQRQEAEDARRSVGGILHQGDLGVSAVRHAVGRQPAKGGRGSMASPQTPPSPARRADPGGRHRGAGRDLPARPQGRGRGHVGNRGHFRLRGAGAGGRSCARPRPRAHRRRTTSTPDRRIPHHRTGALRISQ